MKLLVKNIRVVAMGAVAAAAFYFFLPQAERIEAVKGLAKTIGGAAALKVAAKLGLSDEEKPEEDEEKPSAA